MPTSSIAHILHNWQKTIDRIDIELIIGFVLRKSRTFVLAHDDFIPSKEEYTQITHALHQRSQGMPLAYITGQKEFYGRTFRITKKTLVPRPETELYIPAIMRLPQTQLRNALIIDVGTGSGIIAVTLAKEFLKNHTRYVPNIIASDISHDALVIAKHNASAHRVSHHIRFFLSDLLHNHRLRACIGSPQYQHIIIAANLPYVDIEQKEILLSQKESRSLSHEPSLALWTHDHGLYQYKKLTKQIFFLKKKFPQKKFILLYEITPTQKELLHEFMRSYAVSEKHRSVIYDLAQKPRIFSICI